MLLCGEPTVIPPVSTNILSGVSCILHWTVHHDLPHSRCFKRRRLSHRFQQQNSGNRMSSKEPDDNAIILSNFISGEVSEMAYERDLGSRAARLRGSSPLFPTILYNRGNWQLFLHKSFSHWHHIVNNTSLPVTFTSLTKLQMKARVS